MSVSMGLSDEVKAYVQRWGVREHPALARCRAETAADPRRQMQISPEHSAYPEPGTKRLPSAFTTYGNVETKDPI